MILEKEKLESKQKGTIKVPFFIHILLKILYNIKNLY